MKMKKVKETVKDLDGAMGIVLELVESIGEDQNESQNSLEALEESFEALEEKVDELEQIAKELYGRMDDLVRLTNDVRDENTSYRNDLAALRRDVFALQKAESKRVDVSAFEEKILAVLSEEFREGEIIEALRRALQ